MFSLACIGDAWEDGTEENGDGQEGGYGLFHVSFLYLGLGCAPFIFTCRSLGLFMFAMFSGFSARCHSSHIVWEVLAWVLLSDAIGPKSTGSLGPVMVWIGVVVL